LPLDICSDYLVME